MSTPITMCEYAKTCGDRLAYGDMKHGCNRVDQKNCQTARITSRRAFLEIKVEVEKEKKVVSKAGPFDALFKAAT
jgi:hypothetical protein